MKNQTDEVFVSTLEENIHKHSAIKKLISDNAKSEISKEAEDILCHYVIDDWHLEPYHQLQNFAENQWGAVKDKTNVALNKIGAPTST